MEQPYPTTLTEAMEKAAQGLRVTAEGIESAAKEIKAIENPVPPNALKQLDRIEQLLKEKIPSDLPEKLQMIDKLIKLIPVDLDKQLERLQTGFRGLNRETDKDHNNVFRMYNSRLFAGGPLKPLLNIRGDHIINFPRTVTHIHALDTQDTNALCRELGVVPSEDPKETKKRLLEFIGCGKFELGI